MQFVRFIAQQLTMGARVKPAHDGGEVRANKEPLP